MNFESGANLLLGRRVPDFESLAASPANATANRRAGYVEPVEPPPHGHLQLPKPIEHHGSANVAAAAAFALAGASSGAAAGEPTSQPIRRDR